MMLSRYDSYHIPDEIIAGLKDGSVDHIEYPIESLVGLDQIAVAVMADGSRREFSYAVTQEMRDAEREKRRQAAIASGALVLGAKMRVTVDFSEYRGVARNCGS